MARQDRKKCKSVRRLWPRMIAADRKPTLPDGSRLGETMSARIRWNTIPARGAERDGFEDDTSIQVRPPSLTYPSRDPPAFPSLRGLCPVGATMAERTVCKRQTAVPACDICVLGGSGTLSAAALIRRLIFSVRVPTQKSTVLRRAALGASAQGLSSCRKYPFATRLKREH